MGLDGVELVMELEEEFGITITDDEATGLDRVGKVVDCIYAKIRHRGRDGCISARTFYHFRRALMHLAGAARRDVRPEGDLDSLVPVQMRRDAWGGLRASGLKLPALRRPKGLVAALVLLVLAFSGFAALTVGVAFGGQIAACAALLCCAAAAYLADRLSSPWATHIPDTCTTVGDAVLCSSRAPSAHLSRGEASYKVRQIVSEQLGVPFSSVTEEADFVRDLHLDE